VTYLIQNKKTREYFHQGRWTVDTCWAEEFSDVARALTACLRHKLRDVELVLQFGGEAGKGFSLHLTLPDQLMFA